MKQNSNPNPSQEWINNFTQFTDALAVIERKLYQAHGPILTTDRPPVAVLLDRLGDGLGISLSERNLLRHAQNVRNARMHADPGITVSVELLQKIQLIAKRLSPENTALSLLRKAKAGGTSGGVLAIKTTDNLREVLVKMATGDFSQVPVYDGEKMIGLLTAERLLLHIASSLKFDSDPIALIDMTIQVSDVEGAITPCPRFAMAASSTMILEAFREAENSGSPLAAVIITQTGQPDEKPLAIVSATDFPLLA